MTRRIAVFTCALSFLAPAEDGPRQIVELTKTEHADFVPGGTLRVEDSVDELILQGWDRPDVEITATVSSGFALAPRKREKAANQLGQVKVTAQRRGDELVVSTMLPSKHRRLGDLYLRCQISLPRTARVVVRHQSGEVHVTDIIGDLDIRVPRGLISLSLPDRPYDIDAKSDFGSVTSYFPGHAQRRFWLTGHQFLQNAPSGAAKLHLRAGYGDIEIMKIYQPPAPAPTP